MSKACHHFFMLGHCNAQSIYYPRKTQQLTSEIKRCSWNSNVIDGTGWTKCREFMAIMGVENR